jgi:hypothetical protein
LGLYALAPDPKLKKINMLRKSMELFEKNSGFIIKDILDEMIDACRYNHKRIRK